MSSEGPLIVKVRRGSQHDGPGLRSVVFFKGCRLRCSFCQNPESQLATQEIATQSSRCIRCGACLEVCPNGAIAKELQARLQRDQCQRCGACTRACPSLALRLVGSAFTPHSLAEVLLRDVAYYHHSGGGVTLSGGECLLYPEYLSSLLDYLQVPMPLMPRGVSVVVQTGGEFPFEPARNVLLRVALIQFDLKFADPKLHLAHTGRSNERIVDNLKRLLALDAAKVQIRVPLIPEVTATQENFRGIAILLREIGGAQVSLLPYNPLGFDSAVAVGQKTPLLRSSFLAPEEHGRLIAQFRAALAESKTSSAPQR